ncbi:MAG: type II toxin-antitoxin system HipA family toxin [Deltaproteobacteria bacterium]|nr:type II toxin-antitoxin system HipA family toxin [Deltaproteobacteria bacterium]
MTEDKLLAFHFTRQVGTLSRGADGALLFQYEAGWLAFGNRFALATSLPLREERVETSFFSNLLPEAGARERIAKNAGISVGNDFEFLRIFGGDCAGSLAIFPPGSAGKDLAESTEPKVPDILLTDEHGLELSTRSGFAEFFHPDKRVRLSLAGAQNKLAVVVTSAGLAIPTCGRPSTHILKLPNPDYKGLVENEALMLSLAKAVGLPVVEHDVVELGGTRMLLLTRYDRARDESGGIARLHQQDLCQALGYPPDIKYEKEGGPSLADAFDLVRDEVDDPLSASRAMVGWVVFNVLVHNADAHAKNLSLLRKKLCSEPDRFSHELAPFYDLVCTGTYPLDHHMAMSVGGQLDPGAISKKNWTKLAADIGVGKQLFLKTVAEMGARLPALFDAEVDAFLEKWKTLPRRQQLEDTVKKRIKKTLSLL